LDSKQEFFFKQYGNFWKGKKLLFNDCSPITRNWRCHFPVPWPLVCLYTCPLNSKMLFCWLRSKASITSSGLASSFPLFPSLRKFFTPSSLTYRGILPYMFSKSAETRLVFSVNLPSSLSCMIPCPFRVCSVFVPCLLCVRSVSVPCPFRVHSVFIPCQYRVRFVSVPCRSRVCAMSVPYPFGFRSVCVPFPFCIHFPSVLYILFVLCLCYVPFLY
jgi:hypothetical protein